MKEVYMVVDDWDTGSDNYIFECAEDAEQFAKCQLIGKLGKGYVEELEEFEPGWLEQQFRVYALKFRPKEKF